MSCNFDSFGAFGTDKVLVFGHRGFSEKFPENTMLSFAACADNPAIDGVELDVHLCKSGEVVVAHDFSLKRTAGLDINIEDLTWDELKEIDVGSFKGSSCGGLDFSGARVPLLEDLFRTFGDRFIYDIELKVRALEINRALSRKVWDLVRAFGLEKRVAVSSFNPFALRAFGRVCKGAVPRADIFDQSPSIPKVLQKGQGHVISRGTYLKPDFRIVDTIYIEKYAKLPLVVWTVNDFEDARRLLSLNKEGKKVIYGMIGNDPEMLARVVKDFTQTCNF